MIRGRWRDKEIKIKRGGARKIMERKREIERK